LAALFTVFFLISTAGAAHAGTLVVQGEEGVFQAGMASKWWADGKSVHFQLSSEEEAQAVAIQLLDALSGAKVDTKGDVLVVSGIPEPALLEQLSRFSLAGGGAAADPLAELAQAGVGAVAFKAPEGGGSIRATNPSFAIPAGVFGPPPESEKMEAQVVSIERKRFPQVVVKLKVRKVASDKDTKKAYKRNSVFSAPVLMNGGEGLIDFDAELTRQNLVAYYLQPGDRVVVHVRKDEAAKSHIDWIGRKR
ncbi:MAG: hypothetical protein AAFY60_12645, partial [Myxococcota bacterium]